MKINIKTIIYSSLSLLLGFGIGFFVFNHNMDCGNIELQYINKELSCHGKLVVRKSSYIKLKNTLENFIKEKKKENKVTEVSLYFRDLENGPTLGIEEHALFSPASLLKLPLLITYFDLKDEEPDLFERKLILKSEDNVLEQTIPPRKFIVENREYSVYDFMSYMIKYSDNKAYFGLLEYLQQISPDKDLLKQTFVDLGIIDPHGFTEDTLSVKSYGSIFVQLFYSSYFNNNNLSNEVLAMLADVDWKDGINKGVPEGTVVAHKFGERGNFNDGKLKQLHDCGIVYYPDNPYLICIMTRGYDFTELSKIIGEISRMVYEEFDSRKL